MNTHLVPSAAVSALGSALLALALTHAAAPASASPAERPAAPTPTVGTTVLEHPCFAVRHSWNESLAGPAPLCTSVVAAAAPAGVPSAGTPSFSEAVSRRSLAAH
jgi:hypothetical protein